MSEQADQEDKTEEPTQRKLEEAIKKGDVAKSQEINTFFVLGGFTLCLLILGGQGTQGLMLDLRSYLMNAHQVPADLGGIASAGRHALVTIMFSLLIPMSLIGIAGLLGGAMQHRFLWTFEPLTPKFNRISPMAGFKRLFGKESLINFLKGLLKITIVGAVAGTVLWKEHDRLESLATLDVAAISPAIMALSLKLLFGVLIIYFFFAGGDYLYQRFSWIKRQRMTRNQIKDEHKESEGNPEIKGKLRQIRMARLKKRMMAAVPKATVIITNPTHYAVALQYETGMDAPLCVAKGVDVLALKIREIAGQHDIPIVENPPLARALHAVVKIDEEIPVEHYKAVAEVIGYVLRLRRRTS